MATHSQSHSTSQSQSTKCSSAPTVGSVSELVGSPFLTGFIAGVFTDELERLTALVVLNGGRETSTKVSYNEACKVAAQKGGRLPTLLEAAYLRALNPHKFKACWHWTSEPCESNNKAWGIQFSDGSQSQEFLTLPGLVIPVLAIHIEERPNVSTQP